MLKAESNAEDKLKKKYISNTPPSPAIKANVYASFALILPFATGLLPVRFINASVSFSTAWFIALALPVIIKPATNKIIIYSHEYSTILGASR